MAVNIDSLQIEIEATSSEAAKRVQDLADALTNLKAASKGGAGLTTVSKQLQVLASAAASLNNTGIGKLKELAPALNSLSSIQKSSGLNSTINALKKLPEVSASLKEADLGEFATQMNQVASAVRPLATEMQKVSNGFSAFPIRIQKIIQSNAGLAASNNKTAKSFGVLGSGISSVQAKFGIYSVVFQQIAKIASSWVKESNDYVENLNLFTVAMGDAAESALEYAETVRDAVGIDPSEWIRNQGVFKQITSGFGVMEEKANLMSQNLTQLGYDISSFYNISIEEAMEKLQSGIAGEIEPLRRLGYAIDVATLQQVAYEHGIQQSVNTMNQAQKSQLRYIAIMEQSGNAMQDLARTSMTPSNALRILNQQITQLSRALGNLLIPLLQKIIPWVQAFVEVITDAIQALAVFFGFELPTIDYSGMDGIASGANDVEDAISGATGAAKEMKKALLGIDELTILEPTKTGGAGGAGGIGNGDLGLELPEYDFLAGLKEQTDDLKTRMKDLLENYIIPIGAGLEAWRIAKTLIPDLRLLQGILGAGLIAVGVSLLIDSIQDIIISGKLTWENILTGAAGGAAVGGGLGFMLAKKLGLTWAQGMLTGAVIGVGLFLLIAGITAQVAEGVSIKNGLISAVGGALAGAILGRYLSFKKSLNPASGLIGGLVAGVGLSLLISSIISIAQNGLSIGNGIMGAIGGALAGFGIGAIVAGGPGAAFGLIIGLGVSLVIEGITAQISSGAASLSGGLMTILGSALAGAGIGSVIPVIGSAAGAVLGLGVGVILEIVGIKEAGKAAYEATEDFKVMENILDRCADASGRADAAMDNLKSGVENLDSISVDFLTANALADAIFDINEKANATPYELQKMAVMVDTLNSMNIDGLNLSLDETGKIANTSRAEVKKLIESLEQEAKMEAMRDILVQSYKDQYQAIVDAERATRDYTAATQALDDANRELYNTPLLDLTKRAEIKAAIDKETEAVNASRDAYNDAKTTLNELDGTIDTFLGQLVNLQTGQGDLKDSTYDWADTQKTLLQDAGIDIQAYSAIVDESFGDLPERMRDYGGSSITEFQSAIDANTPALKNTMKDLGVDVSNELVSGANSVDIATKGVGIGVALGDGVASGIEISTSKVAKAAEKMISTANYRAKNAAKIHSPSRLFRDEVGLNIGLGVAVGLEDSKYAILSEMSSINREMENLFTSGAFNQMPTTFSVKQTSSINQELANTVMLKNGRESQQEDNINLVNTLYAVTQQIISAIEENGVDVFVDGDGTTQQNRKNRMYGKTLQRV
ncbi:hypothetical protein MM59RIKEN_07380 [Pusillibacter faecalis]|uniref:Uncharacterized protein n=1 Tax=Pusillibacter faecalis TaxID=2714358 RepID=A0A810Q528_9FIRM|nr:hypothetical protein [Pusillibacter faecalis]BCK83419.1 hypothetical protein MM59RIKEN_07380 [Pusillibacter faecalis]